MGVTPPLDRGIKVLRQSRGGNGDVASLVLDDNRVIGRSPDCGSDGHPIVRARSNGRTTCAPGDSARVLVFTARRPRSENSNCLRSRWGALSRRWLRRVRHPFTWDARIPDCAADQEGSRRAERHERDTVKKAVDLRVIPARRRGSQSWIEYQDVAVLTMLGHLGRLGLRAAYKRRGARLGAQRRLARGARAAHRASCVRKLDDVERRDERAERYVRLRDQWIVSDPAIKGGEPGDQGLARERPLARGADRRGRGRRGARRGLPAHPGRGARGRRPLRPRQPAARAAASAARGVKLWFDEDLSPTLVQVANARGFQATCNRDRGMLGASDAQLRAIVQAEGFVLVTDNASDFRPMFARDDIHPGLAVHPRRVRPRRAATTRGALIDFIVDAGRSGRTSRRGLHGQPARRATTPRAARHARRTPACLTTARPA